MTLKNRQDLMTVFATIAEQFEQVKHTVSGLEGTLFASLDELKREVNECPSQLARDTALNKAMKPLYQAIRDQVNGWIEDVHRYERNTRFRERFDDSLLIFAYGKVKAGKSSLGNYLAYGHSRPDQTVIAQADPKPEFFKYDASGVTDEDAATTRRFRVDTLEATSSIQGFQLPGLTWVDVPGLDSLTQENGHLAQQYVEAADLVLFLTKSSSPLRTSELQHILQLLQQRKKPLAVVITACDTIEEDEMNGEIVRKLVMKSKADLQAQKAWVQQQLDSLPADARRHVLSHDIHTISVRYAEEHPDEAGWRDSGLAGFAEQIAAIAEGEGLRLKRQTPLKNLQAFTAKLRRSKQVLDRYLREMEDTLCADQEAFRQLARRAQTAMHSELRQRLDEWVTQHAMDDAAFRRAVSQGATEVVQKHLAPLREEIAKRAERFDQRLQALDDVSLDLPGFQRRTRRVQRYTTHGQRIGSSSGAALGAVVGAFFGPVGSLAGAVVGGYLGGKMGEWFDEEETFVVDLGDNRLEVHQETLHQILKWAEGKVDAYIDHVEHQALRNWIATLRAALDRLENHIDRVESELEAYL